MSGIGSYLRKHSEALVKDVGIEAACDLTGKSKATLGRYYSDADEHADRFMPIDVVAALEAAARFPHVTAALADLRGITMAYDEDRRNAKSSGVNEDVVALAQRFALLMGEYNSAIGDGRISINESKRLLRETVAIQQVLLEMKLNLEVEANGKGFGVAPAAGQITRKSPMPSATDLLNVAITTFAVAASPSASQARLRLTDAYRNRPWLVAAALPLAK